MDQRLMLHQKYLCPLNHKILPKIPQFQKLTKSLTQNVLKYLIVNGQCAARARKVIVTIKTIDIQFTFHHLVVSKKLERVLNQL